MEMFHQPVYLDYHATTPVDHRVLEVMLPFFTEQFGNPASRSHPYGWKASEAVEMARTDVAALLSVTKEEIFFTSGATEGLNMAIKGLSESLISKGKHIITVSTEHHAVLDPVKWLSKKGFEITYLGVDENGMIDLQHLDESIRKDTIMVIVMWANNETGVIQDINSIGEICSKKNVAFICDATQAVGKIQVHPQMNGVDILVCSAHKMYGPKGLGAVFIARNNKRIKPQALIHGGGHEGGFRSGTLNVPGIVGLGAASAVCLKNQTVEANTVRMLRGQFESIILASVEQVKINGHLKDRLQSVSNLRVLHVDSQAVMTRLRTKISISSGSACSSADPAPSHVLLAMGLSNAAAKGSFRISLGRPTTIKEVEFAASALIRAIEEYRSESPVWQMFKKGIDVS